MYTGNTAFKEFSGWEAIRQNTVDHIQHFPNPIPIPGVDQTYAVTVFQETALVLYTKMGEKGPVKETRLMVKEGEKWKIARMQKIYWFSNLVPKEVAIHLEEEQQNSRYD